VSESLSIIFFLALAWGGVRLMHVISEERLMTVDWFPSAVAQSVIPIASVLFVVAELVSLPMAWKRLEQSRLGPDTADYIT
jgi:TRAP-type C4-dicarboxylate transport system permease small subunit